jgi:uncharacterized protein (DUF1697 family)
VPARVVATIFMAFLRAINVGGRKPVAMADLRQLLAQLGFADARSLLQSGNLLFRGKGWTSLRLEGLLKAEARERLGLETDVFIRTAKEWHGVIERNPFPREAERDPGHLLVMLLKDAPGRREVEALRAAIKGPETVRAAGKQLYIVYPKGSGRSRLTNALIERTLGTRATGRNWNTVLRLDAVANSL